MSRLPEAPAKRRLVGKFKRRTFVKAEELPNGDFLVTDESGTRTLSRSVFLKNFLLVGQPEYV